MQAPEKYVELDPEMARTLLDQRDSGKQLLLITNSDYEYTDRMMSFAYNRFLPNGMKWRELFDMVGWGLGHRATGVVVVCGCCSTGVHGLQSRPQGLRFCSC